MPEKSLAGNLLSLDQLAKARALFPHLAQEKIYLNHAATSPLSSRVVQAMTTHLQERSCGWIDNYLNDVHKKDECRGFIQQLIHAEFREFGAGTQLWRCFWNLASKKLKATF